MICACLDDMHGQILISVLSVEGVKVGLEIPPILQTLRLHSLVISPFKQPLIAKPAKLWKGCISNINQHNITA